MVPVSINNSCDYCSEQVPYVNGNKILKCARCLNAVYCNQVCQTNHWSAHKQLCRLNEEKVCALKEKKYEGLHSTLSDQMNEERAIFLRPITQLISAQRSSHFPIPVPDSACDETKMNSQRIFQLQKKINAAAIQMVDYASKHQKYFSAEKIEVWKRRNVDVIDFNIRRF